MATPYAQRFLVSYRPLAGLTHSLPYCPENLEVCPAPPTGCSYGEAHTDSCGCQTGCPPVDCPSKTNLMTNLVANADHGDNYYYYYA